MVFTFIFYFYQTNWHVIEGVNEINLPLTFLPSYTINFLAVKVKKESKSCFSKTLRKPSHIIVPRRPKAVFFSTVPLKSTVPANSTVPFENPPPRIQLRYELHIKNILLYI